MRIGVFLFSRSLLKRYLRRRVIVNLKDSSSFAGVLYLDHPEGIVLRESSQLDAGPKREPVGVDGELLILKPDIAFIQAL